MTARTRLLRCTRCGGWHTPGQPCQRCRRSDIEKMIVLAACAGLLALIALAYYLFA